ncbi:MAG: mechanosensitive ion channel [Planctomycetes bacterium]|nr:mechanosensitive ion channel [Planctomycetota bacterium]
MTDFWGRFVAGGLGGWAGLGLGVLALVLSLALLALVFRPLVELLSSRDPEVARRSRVRRISFSLLVASFAGAFFVGLFAALPRATRHENLFFEVAELFVIVCGAYGLFEILVTGFGTYLPQLRGRPPVSPIYRDLFRTFVYFALLLWALKQAFPDASIGTLLTTSAILSVVLGLALQDSLSNIFAGLTLSVDRPFQPGDWILIDGQEGKVVEANWRATRLLNRDNDMVHLPNSLVAKSRFVNCAQPNGLHLCRRSIGVEFGSQPNKVRAVLIDMMNHVEGVLRDPAPDVFTLEYGPLASSYEMRFWIVDLDRRTRIESDVMRGAWYHLKRNHIRVAFPSQDLYLRREVPERKPEEIFGLLRNVDILRPLVEEDLKLLADDLSSHLFARGEVIFRQGEKGTTFYIIKSGAVSVRVRGTNGAETDVAALKPGDFFGEVALLTGEPRNSTCTALEDCELLCLDRESFSVLLSENPPVAKMMSEVIAMRSASAQQKLAQESGQGRPQAAKADEAATGRILEKIWSIFGFRT